MISFLFKGELTSGRNSRYYSRSPGEKAQNRIDTQTQGDEIPNMDERTAQNRAAGNTQQQEEVAETIVQRPTQNWTQRTNHH